MNLRVQLRISPREFTNESCAIDRYLERLAMIRIVNNQLMLLVD